MSKVSLIRQFLQERLNLSRWAIKHWRVTIAIWLVIATFGIFAYNSLHYGLFPDITFPVVIVKTESNLKTVLETETQITKPIETKLQSLAELDDIVSSTYPGQTIISLLFAPGSILESQTNIVQQAVKQINLPSTTKLEVIPLNLNESVVITYAITSKTQTLPQLIALASEKIVKPIQTIPGVLNVNLLGDDSAQFPTRVRFNGENALGLQVVKQSKAHTLEVVKLVEQKIEQLQPNFPQIQIKLAQTQANFINEATHATLDALFGAIILAVLVIFPFLRNWQATLITALAIPISILGTFIVMALAGFNLETITLLALALVIGIIVDDAIVDVENILRRISCGETPTMAARLGTDEIGLAVSASTLTIAAVFLPVGLMGGRVGQFFQPFGVTIAAAVLISLLVSRTLSPVLASLWLKSSAHSPSNKTAKPLLSPPAQPNSEASSVSPRSNLTAKPLLSPPFLRGVRGGSKSWGGGGIQTRGAKGESSRETQGGEIESGRKNSSSETKNFYHQLLLWSLNHRYWVVGLAIASFIAGIALIPFIPQGFIPKLDRGEFNLVYTTALPKLQRSVAIKPTLEESEYNFDWLGDLAKSPEKLLLKRTNKIGENLEKTVLQLSEVESVFTLAGVRGEVNKGKIYIKLKEPRNFTTAELQEKLRSSLPKIKGVTTSVEDIPFIDTEAEKPLQIALLGENRENLTQISSNLTNQLRQLPGFADVTVSWEENKIEHLNQKRVVYVSSNLDKNISVGDATKKATAIAQELLMPGVTLQKWGDSAQSSDVLGSFALTLVLSIICIIVVLLILFGSFLEPLVILLSLPLSIVGAMLALLITQSDFGMISLIALIFLLGLINKNAILLLDYIKQLRLNGLSRTEAILTTGAVRLRPILMTTGSTILGMLPIAIGLGAGSQLRQPMAVAIIGGMVTSTLLSLIVVPVFYTLIDDWLGSPNNS